MCSRRIFFDVLEQNYSGAHPVAPRLITTISDFLNAINLSNKTGAPENAVGLIERIELFTEFYNLQKSRKNSYKFFLKNENGFNSSFYFRGVTNCIYPEMAGIFRKDFYKNEDILYRELLVREPSAFSGKKAIEVLTEMQHYELPTRLLDVSSNPLVALYMACSPLYCRPNEWNVTDGEVIAYKAEPSEVLYSNSDKVKLLACLPLLKESEKNAIFQSLAPNSVPTLASKKALERLLSFVQQWDPAFKDRVLAEDLSKSYFVRPPMINARIAAQQGAFILQGLDINYIGKHFQSTRFQGYPRLIIPGKNKGQILAELSALGINDATMFPDLDHIARFLRNKTAY